MSIGSPIDSTSLPLHLVTVWNPAYAANAIEEHLRVLLTWTKQFEHNDAGDDDLYVWWGKVRSPNRQQPQSHLDEIRRLRTSLATTSGETHLYLTDYRSLYVGDMDDIIEGALPDSEQTHVPEYYRQNKLNCDFWFKLLDIRRLVTDDLLGVIDELKKLRNVHYEERPVSLYGGMVDLPLFVTRPDRQHFFGEAERDAWTDGTLWAEFDARTGSSLSAMESELRDNLFGQSVWAALEPTTRTFIATAEHMFRSHRHDPTFDFSPVLSGFAKAFEVQCNCVLRNTLRGAPPKSRLAKLGDRTVDVVEEGPLTLAQLGRCLRDEPELSATLNTRLANGRWFTETLPIVLLNFVDVRNPAIHEAVIDRPTALLWRNRFVGVGCAGDLVELAKVRPK